SIEKALLSARRQVQNMSRRPTGPIEKVRFDLTHSSLHRDLNPLVHTRHQMLRPGSVRTARQPVALQNLRSGSGSEVPEPYLWESHLQAMEYAAAKLS